MHNYAKRSNLIKLQLAAAKIGDLRNQVVFVGGCTTGLLITDPLVPDVRTTLDVDCIVDVISITQYYKIQERLRSLGFKEKTDVICRWYFDDVILDVMPTDENILGFSNIWYKEAIDTSTEYVLPNNIIIRLISAPYLLATKFEAFKNRGNGDYMASHDFEDIITIIDGRLELVEEIINARDNVRKYLQQALQASINDQKFLDAMPGHMNQYGGLWQERSNIVLQRINSILAG